MKKAIIKITIVIILFIAYAYFIVIDTTPNNIVILEGEKLKTETMLGFSLKDEDNEEVLTTSANMRRKSNEQSRYRDYKIKFI